MGSRHREKLEEQCWRRRVHASLVFELFVLAGGRFRRGGLGVGQVKDQRKSEPDKYRVMALAFGGAGHSSSTDSLGRGDCRFALVCLGDPLDDLDSAVVGAESNN